MANDIFRVSLSYHACHRVIFDRSLFVDVMKAPTEINENVNKSLFVGSFEWVLPDYSSIFRGLDHLILESMHAAAQRVGESSISIQTGEVLLCAYWLSNWDMHPNIYIFNLRMK